MALTADAGRGVRAAESDVLVDGDVVVNLGAFADHAETVVEEEILPDFRARVNVDAGQEARDMIGQPREEIKVAVPQPVADTVKAERNDAGIKQ